MNRLLFRSVFRHGDHHHHNHPTESISKKPFFKHYTQGITLSFNNQLQEANNQFSKCLQEIAASKEDELGHYPYVLRRIANNYRRLGQMSDAEKTLYEVIKHKREKKVTPVILYDDYDTLFKHMLSYDLTKAVKLCRALLLKQKDEMPISHIKLFNFNLGTAYLLAQNYQDAKNRLSQCLQADPQGKLKAFAYNNLGLACEWHKNPMGNYRQKISQENSKQIQKDWSQVREIFAKAIQVCESSTQQNTQSMKMMRDEALDFKRGSINEAVTFYSPESIRPLFNLAKYYINNDPLKRSEVVFWMKKALETSQSAKKQKQFDRILVENCLLVSDLPYLNQLLPTLIQKYNQQQQFAQECYYCHVFARVSEPNSQISKQNKQRAELIQSVIPKHLFKMPYIAIEQLNLLS